MRDPEKCGDKRDERKRRALRSAERDEKEGFGSRGREQCARGGLRGAFTEEKLSRTR